jgi:hypothetical protein
MAFSTMAVQPNSSPAGNFGFSPQGIAPQQGYNNPMGMNPMGDAAMLAGQATMLVMMTELLMLMMAMMGARQPQAAGVPSSGEASPVGASSGGSSSAPASEASGVAPASSIGGGSANGRTLAAAAEKEAKAEGTTGWCYRGVSRALKSIGVSATGESAYMAADQLARNPKFKEVSVPNDKLSSLPPGAVVVWNKGPGHQHGHISVALGDGREASDHVQKQISNLNGCTHRVFMPV